MEFSEVVRRRRMVRRYDPDRGVSRGTVTALLDLATRAPSAGFSQGWHFLVLDTPADRDRWWAVTARGEDSWLAGMRTAPVVVVLLADPRAYARRYAAADKVRSDLSTAATGDPDRPDGLDRLDEPDVPDVPAWPVPWWDVDTGMAGLLTLLGAVDAGLGGCLAGVPADRWDAVRAAFDLPERLRPVGIVTLGHPAPDADRGRGRTRRPLAELVHWGRWGEPDEPG